MTEGIPDKPSKPPSKNRFAQMVKDGIRKAGVTADIVYDREQFCLSQGDKDGPQGYAGKAVHFFSFRSAIFFLMSGWSAFI